MESSVYKNIISTPLRCLIAGRRPGAQLAVNRDRRSRPPAPPIGWLRCRAALEPGSLYPRPRTATLRVATLPRLFRPRSSLGEPTPPDEPDCCSKTAIEDRAPLRRPPRGGRNFVAAPPATGPSLKNNPWLRAKIRNSRAPIGRFTGLTEEKPAPSARLGDSYYIRLTPK